MTRNKNIIGIDVGGTSIKFGIVSPQGKIHKQFSLPTLAFQSPAKVIEQISLGIEKITRDKNERDFLGIGIGIPGKVDIKTGYVTSAPNFKNWDRVDVRRSLSRKFKYRIELDNDANCAALGELHFGRGKKIKSFVMITLGTGVGGGIIINGNLIHGESGGAGEIGHISIDYNGPLCNCGKHGCVEAYVGNNYIKQRTIQKLHEYSDSIILDLVENNLDLIEPKLIYQAAQKNDLLAVKILQDTGFYLGIALASVANILDVKTFLIGGGVAEAGKTLLDSILNSIKEHGVRDIVKDVKVLSAKLKNKAGILGASLLLLS